MKKYPERTEGIPCIRCGKEVKLLNLDDDKIYRPSAMYNNGNVAELYAGYGSILDGDIYLIAVCDDCTKQHALKIGEYM